MSPRLWAVVGAVGAWLALGLGVGLAHLLVFHPQIADRIYVLGGALLLTVCGAMAGRAYGEYRQGIARRDGRR